jgi:pimeloyl-ACP methyl ester carboxylesterase
MSRPLEHGFVRDGLTLVAREWGDPDGLPVLALHGWLDNCGSFAVLAPLLAGVRLVALDFAGHGLSSHRSADATYNIWQDVGDIHAVVQQLGWSSFALLGHSRGAMIATLTAGTFPERITHLGLIDSFVPQVLTCDQIPGQLRRSIVDRNERLARTRKIYPTLDEAMAVRLRGDSPLSVESAPFIGARGVEAVDGGYRWRSDEKLKIASEIKLTPDIVREFVRAITCPALLLLSNAARMSRFYGMEQQLSQLKVEIIAGSHHFHMEETAPAAAASLNRFFVS